jgi:magnesium transporter
MLTMNAFRRSGWRPRIKARTPPGTAPGTLATDPQAPPSVIRVVAYSADEVVEQTLETPGAIADYMNKWPVLWVNIDGVGDAETLQAVGQLFDLHPLALEDVANCRQRPKHEEYDACAFVVVRMPKLSELGFRNEQVSMFLGPNFVITFQEWAGDCFEPVRKRIRESTRSRFVSADYLAYALLDAIVDSYFPVLEDLSERLDDMEEEIALNPTAGIVARVFATKHILLSLRRAIWPIRDMLNSLIRDPVALISDPTKTYLRDCYDHAVRIVDLVETYRDLNSGLMEFYQSSVGHRMNEIMKVLTIIATIFIPLTFIAGIYGMNFSGESSPWSMPELYWYWGYPVTLLVMAVITLGMIVFFRRKGWLG